MRLLPIHGASGHASCSVNYRVNGHFSHQLTPLNFAPLPLDQVHQGQKDTFTYGALTPTYVEVVLVRQRCRTPLYSALSGQSAEQQDTFHAQSTC